MSIWKEIREKSIGEAVRAESLPDPVTEQKEAEEMAAWEKERQERKEENDRRISRSALLGSGISILILLVISLVYGDGYFLLALPILFVIYYLSSRWVLKFLSGEDDD